jgi:hypothetical protein
LNLKRAPTAARVTKGPTDPPDNGVHPLQATRLVE